MANALFNAAKADFLTAALNLSSVNLAVALIDHGTTTPSVSTHDFMDDLRSAVVYDSVNNDNVAPGTDYLAGKTTTNGTFDANDITLQSVSGSTAESIVIYEDDAGGDAASRLVVFIDTATGLAVTPNGGDISITWDASGIFSL